MLSVWFQLHPDSTKKDDTNSAEFTAVNEAYSILRDVEKRKEYDESLKPKNNQAESEQRTTDYSKSREQQQQQQKQEESWLKARFRTKRFCRYCKLSLPSLGTTRTWPRRSCASTTASDWEFLTTRSRTRRRSRVERTAKLSRRSSSSCSASTSCNSFTSASRKSFGVFVMFESK